MNILVYYPSNKSSVSIETVVEYFCKKGYGVYFLSHEEKGDIHTKVQKSGAEVFTYVLPKSNSLSFYWKHFLYLIRFTKKYKIDLVYSHLQQPNLIACLAQYFTKSTFVLCRHHSDVGFIYNNKKEQFADKIINRLGRHFIVPSKKVYDQMILEGVAKSKIALIPYAYDFDKYPQPSSESVEQIRKTYKASLFLVIVSRLIKDKRQVILFDVVKQLRDQGYDIAVLAVGEGPDQGRLEEYIHKNNLSKNIFLAGFKPNVIDYLQSADAIVHLSISEASNSVIKEAGLLKKLVMVCDDVGDFDDYIEDGVHGIKLNKESPSEKLEKVLKDLYNNRADYEEYGVRLKKNIFRIYSAPNVLPFYDAFHKICLKGKGKNG